MKDNKGINKGKDSNDIDIDKIKNTWVEIEEKLKGDKNDNISIHYPNKNFTFKRLSDFKSILSKEYSKMEDRIKILETISNTLIEFIDNVAPQNRQSIYIKKILDKKGLMSLDTVNKFLDLIVAEGRTSEAGKKILENTYNGNYNNSSPKKDNLLSLLREQPELLNVKKWKYEIAFQYEKSFKETIGYTLIYGCKKIIENEIKK